MSFATHGAVAVGVLLASVAPLHAESFEFPLLNRTYEAFVEELQPVQIGPAHVSLSSPQHSLSLLDHRATLVREADGSHRATVEIEITASGRLEADLRIGGVESSVDDDLTVPRQRLALVGRVAIARSPDGYVITALELPASVEVRIESVLAGRLFSICHQMALVLVNLSCATLEDALSRVVVPLPESGTTFVLGDAELRPEDRARLDAYLGRDAER
jgi:hypothetical protein